MLTSAVQVGLTQQSIPKRYPDPQAFLPQTSPLSHSSSESQSPRPSAQVFSTVQQSQEWDSAVQRLSSTMQQSLDVYAGPQLFRPHLKPSLQSSAM